MWYIIIAAISVVMFIVFSLIRIPLDDNSKYYILSSISQGLAALLALVFTALLIIIQVFKRYRVWKLVMSSKNMMVIIMFCIGIIFPLLALRLGTTSLMVNVGISIAVVCVFFLIPFIIDIGKIMSGPIILGELEEIILDAVTKKAKESVDSYVKEFRDIWISKIQSRDYANLEKILSIWLNINTRIRRLTNYESEIDVILKVCRRLIVAKSKDVTYTDNYARKIYETFRVKLSYTPPVPQSLYNHYIQKSRDILRLAIRKKYEQLSTIIVETLLFLAWQKWFKAGPIKNRDEVALELIKPLLKIDKEYIKNILSKPPTVAYFEGNGRDIQQKLTDLINQLS